ncbi:hypothetical protein OAD66_07170 [Bacteroidia bacterium]|nr:hypothetical protein [Bacteroidia bacterium]MDB9882898.1 hypothetical protein [Bacteroidia bacterium]
MSNIDDIFKKGLDGKGMEYSDASWASMEQMLNTTKVGFLARYKFLLGFGSLVLVSGLAFLYYVSEQSFTPKKSIATVNKTIKAQSNNTVGQNSSEQLIVEGNLTATNPITTSAQDLENFKNNSENEEVSVKTKIDYQAGKTAKVIVDNALPIEGETLEISSNVVIDFAENIDVHGELSRTLNINPGYNKHPDLFDAELRQIESSANLSVMVFAVLESTEVNSVSTEQVSEENITLTAMSMDEIEWYVTDHLPSKVSVLPSPKTKKFGLNLSPYMGMVNYTKNVVLPEYSSEEGDNLGKSNTQRSFNYGLNIGINRGRWMLSSGLGYLSLREKTNYIQTREDVTYTTAPKIINKSFTRTPRGTRVALIAQQNVDSTTVRTSYPLCEDCEVSFNFVTVPIQLQYTFGKSRLRYFAKTGLTASFLNNAKGTYATLKNTNVDITIMPTPQLIELSESNDVTKVLLQANASLGTKYWITTRWNVWSSYGCGLGLNSMLLSYEQKPKLNIIRIGVEYNL